MFYFLLFLGASLITWGMHKRKREVQIERAGSIKLFSTIDETSQLMPENRDSEMVSDLSDRMEELEKSLFNQLLSWQIEKEQLIEKLNTKTSDIMVENHAVLADTAQIDKTEFFEATPAIEPAEAFEPAAAENAEIIAVEAPEEESLPEKSIPDNIRAYMDYEDQGMTVQQIAGITRRNKGEVLLLKNLSKHYRK